MKFGFVLLFIVANTAVHAADKLPLSEFLQGLHQQLQTFQQPSDERFAAPMIRHVHVDLHVIAEKDAQNNTIYYVLEGVVDRNNIVTQKISFDITLSPNESSAGLADGYRTYSTRRRGSTHERDMRRPRGYYRYPPGRMLDIYPVIIYD